MLALTSVLPLMVSCGGDKGDKPEPPDTGPTKTSVVQFVSKLDDASIGSTDTDYAAIKTYFTQTLKKREGSGLAFVDRSDMNYGSLPMSTGIYSTALSSRHFTCFALNRIVGKTQYQGTAVLVNKYMTDVHSLQLTDNARVTGSTAVLNVSEISNPNQKSSMQMNFWTSRLTDAADVTQLVANIAEMKKVNTRFFFVGTVKKDVLSNLKSAVEGSSAGSFKFLSHPETESSDYVLCSFTDNQGWTMEAGSKTSVGTGINSYEIIFKW